MKNLFCVYCHISPSGKRYVGITCRKPQKRWNHGKGYVGNDYFIKAIEKYGWDSFEHIILYEGLTLDEASDMEIQLIREWDTTNREKGYNLDLGGHHGRKVLSEETKRKIGDAHRGRYTEAQWAATLARRGKGHPQTEESKKKIGDAHRGKHLSEEHKRYLSEINKGKKMDEVHKEKLRQVNMKRVEQLDFSGNLVGSYPSIRDAARAMGVKPPSISACCRGITSNSCGYLWRYAYDT